MAAEALESVGLAHTGRKKFKQFSLGMKQRLGLALALMNHPDFLLLDEPINGLDPEGIVEFRNILLELNRQRQTTILVSSHILTELEQALGERDYEVLPGNVLRLYSRMGEPERVTQALVEGGVALLGVENRGANLEDYFLSMIGGVRRG